MNDMPITSNITTPSSPSFITEPESNSAKVKSRGPSTGLLEYARWCQDNTYDARYDDPYLVFRSLCRKYHGRRTSRGHSFHAKKLRRLWFKSEGNNGPFSNLWTRPRPSFDFDRPSRKRKDELAITVRCLSGGFTQAETEAVIKAHWEHNGEGYDFMTMCVYRATTFADAMKYTEEIRERHAQEDEAKRLAKTRTQILWVLEIRGPAGASPKEIAGAVGREVQAVKKSLERLVRDGYVIRVRRGLYRLSTV